MQTVRLVSTLIIALLFMGCPPPVSDNPNAPPQSGDNPAPVQKHHVDYVSVGKSHTVIVKTDKTLWAVGRNDRGQLGNGDVKAANKLNPVKVMPGVAHVSTGWAQTIILKTNGTLWSTGYNYSGQLGDGSTENKRTPVQVKTAEGAAITEVDQISALADYVMILKKNDTLWAVGKNNHWQLGNGDVNAANQVNPVHVMITEGNPITNVKQVSAGGYHTMILKEDDTLWAVGGNLFGRLGDGTDDTKRWPVQVMEKPPGSSAQPMINVKQVSAGFGHTMIIKKDDTLWAAGQNNHGQLGDNSNVHKWMPVKVMTEVAQVSAGFYHTMIIKKNGELWAFGLNDKGQLGDGSTENKKTAVQVMEIPAGGGPPQPMTGVAQVATGETHTMIVKTNGTLWGTGYNEYGQLGDGSTTDKLNPVQITPIDGCHDYLPGE